MSNLLETITPAKRKESLKAIIIEAQNIEAVLQAIQTIMAKEIELAYEAGYHRFNAFTHECIEITGDSVEYTRWAKLADGLPTTGPDSMLPALYLESKGFKK